MVGLAFSLEACPTWNSKSLRGRDPRMLFSYQCLSWSSILFE